MLSHENQIEGLYKNLIQNQTYWQQQLQSPSPNFVNWNVNIIQTKMNFSDVQRSIKDSYLFDYMLQSIRDICNFVDTGTIFM